MPYLLDTDSASLAFQGHEVILSRIEQAPAQDVWLSSIAAEESMRGALALINHTRDTPEVFGAYSLFAELIAAISEYPVLLYDAPAAQVTPLSPLRSGVLAPKIAASQPARSHEAGRSSPPIRKIFHAFRVSLLRTGAAEEKAPAFI